VSVGAAVGVSLGAAVVVVAVGLGLAVVVAVADPRGVTDADALGVGDALGDGVRRIGVVASCVGAGFALGFACLAGSCLLAGVPATEV
jgi:hypothetical protein